MAVKKKNKHETNTDKYLIGCRLEEKEDDEEEQDPDARRGITYQVLHSNHSQNQISLLQSCYISVT